MSLSRQTPRSIEIVPLTLHIGAEIRGVDLTKPLPPPQMKEVRDAFLKWKVVFFRNQHLDHAQHVAMARQFGEPTIGHAVLGHLDDYPEIYSYACSVQGGDHTSTAGLPLNSSDSELMKIFNDSAVYCNFNGVGLPKNLDIG